MTVTVKPIDLRMCGARDVVTRSLLIAKLRTLLRLSVCYVSAYTFCYRRFDENSLISSL